jgi:predicted dehydrogenase
MRSLIVGMGIGQLYKSVFSNLNYSIETVDASPDKDATYINVESVTGEYDIAVICTPNFTHESIARTIASRCKIVLIEKPGVIDAKSWQCLVEDFPTTRFMMVKNNQYREEIKQFKYLSEQSILINVIWNNKNRIPNPGSWFTTKEKAFGGVSRDLIPHMLSYYCILSNYKSGRQVGVITKQQHKLEDLTDTDYGIVKYDGIHDVDDYCRLDYNNEATHWTLQADWKNDINDDVYISFSSKNSSVKHTLGLCPESAYKKMIEAAVENLNNDEFWQSQFEQDMWIHKQIEKL